MATTTSSNAYTLGVRNALNQKGISNDRIGYDPTNGVTVDGRSFMKPAKTYQGTAYTDQNSFNNAWGQFNAPKGTPTYNPAPVSGQYRPPASNYKPQQIYNQSGYTPQQPQQTQQNGYTGYTSPSNTIDQRISDLYNYLQNQQSFDPYSSSAYKAAEAQAQRAAQANTRAAQESFGSAGFGRSSALGERVAGINNDATEYLLTQVVPQIQAQEEAKRQQQFQNLFSLLAPQQEQQRFAENTAQGRAALTGSFLAPEAQQVINLLTGLKANTEQNWMTMTPEQREAAKAQGDQYRAMLQGMNVDPSLFGSNVKSSQAYQNVGKAGQQTLTANQQAYNQMSDTRDFNEDQRRYKRDFLYKAGRDKVADKQWQDEFNQRVEQDGIQNALAWAQQNLNERQEDRVAANQASGAGPESTQTAQDLRTYYDSMAKYDKDGALTNGPSLEESILSQPISDYDAYQLYLRYGLNWNGPIPQPGK